MTLPKKYRHISEKQRLTLRISFHPSLRLMTGLPFVAAIAM
ncbi:MAG: hypothetical protein PUH57_00530 [Prevotellaceae bacterium]|nr:hypothetical protein [Prevotellaceae bacterium]MDY2749398.1 hypothetical protein [Prevotella sp.]